MDCCENCFYCKKNNNLFECRRKSPQIDGNGNAMFPKVHLDYYCGEWITKYSIYYRTTPE